MLSVRSLDSGGVAVVDETPSLTLPTREILRP
jgi:hypothetical protein